MERKFYPIWLALGVLVLMVISFVAGAGVMYGVASQESVLGITARVAQMAPTVFEEEPFQPSERSTALTPLGTFWQVRDKILTEHVYPIEDDTKLTYGALRGMLAALEEPYSRFMTPREFKEFQAEAEGHFEGIGAYLGQHLDEYGYFEVIVISIIPEGPASKVDLRPRDVIIKVDDRPVRGMTVDRVAKLIKGPKDTQVKLTVLREGKLPAVDLAVPRGPVDIPTIEQKIFEDNIGYVWLRGFHKQAETKLHATLQDLVDQGVKGLVFDLSINGGGLLGQAISVASLFMEDEVVIYERKRGAELVPHRAQRGLVVPRELPLVVLVDEGSASASEIVAAALQDTGRAQIVGHSTFGKSKVQTVMKLIDDSALVLSTAVYLTPNKRDLGEEYEEGERGIKPDVAFPPLELDQDEPFDVEAREQWHQDQIDRAVKVLKETMAESGDRPALGGG